jgi:glucose-6-phosphate isomerase
MQLSGKALEELDPLVISKLNAIIPRIVDKDFNIWASSSEAKNRMGWLDSPANSRKLLTELDSISAWVRSKNYESFVLCGMGGSSLAPEVITKTNGKRLTILDSTLPEQVKKATPSNLEKSVIVIASKSGTTIETLSHLKYFKGLFEKVKLDPTEHLLIITDPNTPLDKEYRKLGYKVFNADPSVGGRYSALTIFGLLPSALVGCDTSILLDDAEEASKLLGQENSAAVKLAAILYSKTDQIVNFTDSSDALPGLAGWIEQLIAESTGKDGTGRLPIVHSQPRVNLDNLSIGFEAGNFDLIVNATLGEHFILWQWSTALLCYLLSVDPFNQPNVASAKAKTQNILLGSESVNALNLVLNNSDFEIRSNLQIKSVGEFLKLNRQYYAILAYLPKDSESLSTLLQKTISMRTNTPTTFGWGPRYLHSTGQIHKGGQLNGGFILITHQIEQDLTIPNESFTFGQLALAQAMGDAQSLTELELPILQIHLKNLKTNLIDIFN